LHKFLRAGHKEQQTIISAAVLVTAIRIALWILPYRWIRAFLLQCPARLHTRQAPVDVRIVVRAVRGVSRLVPGATCLTQAVATRIMLSLMGLPSDLRLGVARSSETGRFEAHAWVDFEGRTIIGGALPGRYVQLPNIDGAIR
jgi:hypothetical protein